MPLFRQTYGEIAVPLEAISGVAFEPERKRGRLRMRLREGADPLLHATGGRLPDPADPYRLLVDVDRAGVAEYVAEEIRRSLLLDQIPKEPTKAYLLPGPPVPVSVRSSDGTVSFDGTRVRIDWADTSDRVKRATGPRIIGVGDLVQVEWLPNSGYEDGFLRFVTRETIVLQTAAREGPVRPGPVGQHPPRPAHRARRHRGHGPAAASLHPHGVEIGEQRAPADGAAVPPPADHHDVLLRRLRELGELHRDGVLTDEEFAMTKAAVLRGF